MKKTISILSAFLLVFSLASCGENSEEAQETTVQTEEVTESDTEAVAEVTTQTETTAEVTTAETQTEETAVDSETMNYADNFYMEYDGDKCYLKYSDEYTKETVVDTFYTSDISMYKLDVPNETGPFIVKVDNIMGRSGICVVGVAAQGPFNFYYYTVVNDTPMLVAYSFGVDSEIKNFFDYYGIDIDKNSDYDWMLDHYNVDIDNDGELEFIANCMHGDGVMITNISKIIDGKAYYSKIYGYDLFKETEFSGISFPPVLYYPEKNLFLSIYNADTDSYDYDNVYEYSIEDYDFDFEPLVKDNY